MGQERINYKIFFVGFNKTGTSSYHQVLEKQLTNAVAHKPRWSDWSFFGDKANLDRFDVFTDGECPHLPTLDRMYPGSKYVLNTRPLSGWLSSRHKSIERSRAILKWFLTRYLPLGFIQPLINRMFLDNSHHAMRRWLRIRNGYHQFVIDFFASRPQDLLVMNIEEEDTAKKLSTFMGLKSPLTIDHENREGKGLGSGQMLDLLKGKIKMADSDESVRRFLEAYNLEAFRDDLLVSGEISSRAPFYPNPSGPRFSALKYLVKRRDRSFSLFVKYGFDQLIKLFRSWKRFEYFVPVQKFGGGSK